MHERIARLLLADVTVTRTSDTITAHARLAASRPGADTSVMNVPYGRLLRRFTSNLCALMAG
jgi:hypothetical protein